MTTPIDVLVVIPIVRLIGPEFAYVPDEVVAQWVVMGREYLDDPEFYRSWNLAQANMVCHLMWLNGLGTTSIGSGGGNQQTAGPIKSYKAGAVQIEYSDAGLSGGGLSGGSGDSKSDTWLKKSSYGEAVIQLEIDDIGGITRYG